MCICSLLVVGAIVTAAEAQVPARGRDQSPNPDVALIVPLRIHILTAADLDLANCKLRDSDIKRIVAKLNSIWKKAGIYFGLESIVHEPAVQTERFRLLVELNEGKLAPRDFASLVPKPSRAFDGLQVVFFHELPMNGAYIGDDLVLAQEGAQLNPVPGGIDEPIPRVLGFALAHALSLEARRGPETSLLAVGTTGIELDAREIARARRVAKTVKGAMTVDEVKLGAKTAQASGQAERAQRLQMWLKEIQAGARNAAAKRPGSAGRGAPRN